MFRRFMSPLALALFVSAISVGGLKAQDAFHESKNREIFYGLGYLEKGDFDMAELRFRLATGERVDKGKAYFLLGIAHLTQREFPQAREAFAEAYRLEPSLNGQLEQSWADLGIKMDIPVEKPVQRRPPARYEGAAALPGTAPRSGARPWTGLVYQSVMPPEGTALRDLAEGKSALRNNMPAMAEEYFGRAIKEDASLAEAYFWLAGAQRKLDNPTAARRSLATAYQLDSSLRAHEGELAQFGSDRGQSTPASASTVSSSCHELHSSCMVTATRCTMNGCVTDFGRQATCTSERRMCEMRNRR